MKVKSLFASVAGQYCPKCRKGKLFNHGVYHLRKFGQMNDHCDHCGQPFELEPSFYYGAMYVSYALQVALFITVFVAIQVLYPEAGLEWYIGSVIFFVVVLFPLLFRLSRSIWIHFFVKYDPGKTVLGADE